ncbi:hypothetical protein EW145_g8676, partial [Phellinidium pouzarii]
MKVFIFGATGFIGLPVAQAFVRNGHEIFGQTRSASKAKLLESEEIIPVIADPEKSEEWVSYVEKADVANHLLPPASTGTWVHGDDRANLTSERALPKNTTAL